MPPEASSVATLDAIRSEALEAVAAAGDTAALREVEVRALGRKGPLARLMGTLGALGSEERKAVGQAANQTRKAIEAAIAERGSELEATEQIERLASERLDVSLPGRRPAAGRVHPITRVLDEVVDIFVGMGFRVAEGPEVESDWHNFGALNMPADHPARSMWDTLYVEPNAHGQPLLRTHTSPVQVRVMQTAPPPTYVVVPGRAFRRDLADTTHLSAFHQIEGLAVDEGISFADLKGTLEVFARQMFGPNLRVKMIPHYFPFTEPSAEVLVSCFVCDGAGCRTCRGEGWIEIMGAGMVHPNVFRAVGYDPEVTGFAFGMGPERIAMLRYEIPDIRWLYENDTRFLEAF
jgi:phenylalanyl-tRNA synthetase alpha chain